MKSNRLLKSLMWADENNGFEDFNPYRTIPSAEWFHPLKAKWRQKAFTTRQRGQGSVRSSAVKIAHKATGQAGLNTIKPSES